MMRSCPFRLLVLLLLLGGGISHELVFAEQLFQLRNGLVLEGSKAEIASLKQGFGAAAAGEIHVRPIWLIDDGLRRIYIHGKGMSAVDPRDIPDLERNIEFWQPKPLGGKVVAGLGSILGLSSFNEFGRRILTIRGPEGTPVQVIQGMTELNSRYVKMIALNRKPALSWDMRVATSSLDSATLNKIFDRRIDKLDLNARLEVVRFYISAERFDDAKAALQQIIDDFPAEAELKAQVTALTERQATQLLDEAETRASAGQYELASGILKGFPVQAVGRITRIQVQDALQKLDASQAQAAELIERLRGHVAQLAPAQAQKLTPIVDEIADGLSADTLPRLSDYSRLGNSDSLPLDNRIALAVAGWLLGSGSGEQNLSVAIALIEIRDLVAEYLRSTDPGRRAAILDTLRNLEGAEPEYVDRMLPLLLPPMPWPEGSQSETIRACT